MKYIKASEFKTECVEVAEDAIAVGPVLLIKNGRPVGSFSSSTKKRFKLGENLGGITILGDIVSPLPGVWDDWERKNDRLYPPRR